MSISFYTIRLWVFYSQKLEKCDKICGMSRLVCFVSRLEGQFLFMTTREWQFSANSYMAPFMPRLMIGLKWWIMHPPPKHVRSVYIYQIYFLFFSFFEIGYLDLNSKPFYWKKVWLPLGYVYNSIKYLYCSQNYTIFLAYFAYLLCYEPLFLVVIYVFCKFQLDWQV